MARLLVLVLILSGCSNAPTDETPRGALRLFLSAMERSEHDPEASREAYALLSASTRRSLASRSHFVNSLGGSELEPWDMLVRGHFRTNFTPIEGPRGMRERIQGARATVSVQNERGDHRAEVPLVREDGRWRIVLAIPPVR
jgi:hypothetical protein